MENKKQPAKNDRSLEVSFHLAESAHFLSVAHVMRILKFSTLLAYIFDGLIRNVQFQPNFNDIIRRVTQNYRN